MIFQETDWTFYLVSGCKLVSHKGKGISQFHKGNRSSHSCSVKKGLLRNFAKFTGKDLCQSLFLNKVAGLRVRVFFLKKSLLKKRLWHRCFLLNFAKFLRNFTSFLLNTSSGCFYTATWGHFSRLLLHHHCKHQIWLVFEMNNVRKWSNTL